MPVPPLSAAEKNLQAEGAEFLVLGHLLIRGVHATKAYTRYPGWDVLASDPDTGKTCRIQVKARRATDYDGGFPIKNFDSEFVVHVALNREYRYRMRGRTEGAERPPEFHVLPISVVKEAAEQAPRWGDMPKVFLRRITNATQYEEAWNLIVDYLRGEPQAPKSGGGSG